MSPKFAQKFTLRKIHHNEKLMWKLSEKADDVTLVKHSGRKSLNL